MPDKITMLITMLKAMDRNLYACHKMSGMESPWKFTICIGTSDCQPDFCACMASTIMQLSTPL